MSAHPDDRQLPHGGYVPAEWGYAQPSPWPDVNPAMPQEQPFGYVQQPVPTQAAIRTQTLPAQLVPAPMVPPAPPVQLPPAPYGTPARDPQRTALAAVITFVAVLFGLWGMLSFLNTLSHTLSSVSSSNRMAIAQLETANKGLAELDRKTANVELMSKDAARLQQLMGGIDASMGAMVEGVGRIDKAMTAMNGSLGQLDRELDAVNASNRSIGEKLGHINSGLASQAGKVHGMRRDVGATAKVLKGQPALLRTTNARLIFVNRVVCLFGTQGILNKLHVRFTVFGIPNGAADIVATLVPPGAWSC